MTGAPEGSSAIDPRIDAVARVLYDRERASATLWPGVNDEEREGWRATASAFLAAADAADPSRSAAPSPAGRLGAVGPPRVYTVKVAPGLDLSEEALETVRLIRWDREEVEALMTRALSELLDRKPESTTYGMARAVFDALASEGRAHD